MLTNAFAAALIAGIFVGVAVILLLLAFVTVMTLRARGDWHIDDLSLLTVT